MKLTKELIDEIVKAADEVEYGNVIIAISGQSPKKVVDIITEKRERYREHPSSSQGVKYQKDN